MRWPTKRDLARIKAEADFQTGIPWEWTRFLCRSCGIDYCTRYEPLLYPPCPNCGTHVGYITKAVYA